ncbi:hypothetical protein chiPu_0029431, partial [Chiloscyllium punctatum]|nr:hypothetical protein [Chiloscyllium punctatum]
GPRPPTCAPSRSCIRRCARASCSTAPRIRVSAKPGRWRARTRSSRRGRASDLRRRAEPSGQRFREAGAGPVSDPRHVAVRADQHCAGCRHRSERGQLPGAGIGGVEQLNPVGPPGDVEAAGLAKIEQRRPRLVQQCEDPSRAARRDQIEIGHAASEQWMTVAELVMQVEARHHRGKAAARLLHAQQFGDHLAQRLAARIGAVERDVRHGVAQYAGRHRMPLGLIAVEQAVRRCQLDHLGELPAQIHRVLHADIEALSAHRRMHMGGIAGQQHA